MIEFTCIECEHKFTEGDLDERTCFKCLDAEETPIKCKYLFTIKKGVK